jgi:cyclohexa-1,5-dienecarbonyl-CoA hydratase
MIRVDITERVAWLTLERAPLNILNIEMLKLLNAALDELAKNTDVSVVVLGAGPECRAFSAGVDVADHTPDKVEAMLTQLHGAIGRLIELPAMTVAAVDGAALGGGAELVIACDMAVATRRSKLGFPEIKLACFPPVALALLPSICGRAAATDLIACGETISSERALQLGLLCRIVSDEDKVEELRLIVASLAERSPAVLRMTARLARQRWLPGWKEAIAGMERAYLSELTKLPDMHEGIAAFMEKRAPKFTS